MAFSCSFGNMQDEQVVPVTIIFRQVLLIAIDKMVHIGQIIVR